MTSPIWGPHLLVNRPSVCSSSGSKRSLCGVYLKLNWTQFSERCQCEGLAVVKGLKQQCMH